MKKMNKKGFTIVELVIVIAVIAILAAVLIPTFSGIVDKANKSKSLQEVRNAYTVYMSEQLHANQPVASPVHVKFGTDTDVYYVNITNGKAEISTTLAGTEYHVCTKDGEKILAAGTKDDCTTVCNPPPAQGGQQTQP